VQLDFLDGCKGISVSESNQEIRGNKNGAAMQDFRGFDELSENQLPRSSAAGYEFTFY